MSLPADRIAAADGPLGTSPEPLSDDAIIRRVIDGEVALFELILRRYNQRLFRIARGIVGDDTEAEDVVQEAYIRSFRNLRQFAGRSQFATWLTKIAIHEATARRRKQRRLSLVDFARGTEIDFMAIQAHHRDAGDEASQHELRLLLAAAVDALPVDLRLVFTLRMIEGLNVAETAECLDVSPANVKVRLHRARLQLRSWIDRQIGKESRELFQFAGDRCDRIVANVMARVARL